MFPNSIGFGALDYVPQFLTKETSLAATLPYVCLVDDHTIRTRDDELFQCIEVQGINSATADDDYISKVSAGLARFIANKRQFFSYYIHKVSRPTKIELAETNDNEFANALDLKWRSHIQSLGINDKAIVITLIKRRTIGQKVSLFGAGSKSANANKLKDDLDLLNEVRANLVTSLDIMKPKLLTASKGELLGFLSSLNTGVLKPVFPSHSIGLISEDIANTNVEFNNDVFRLSGGNTPIKYGSTLAVKTYGDSAYPSMFDELEMPIDLVVTHSFRPATKGAMLERIRAKKRFRVSVTDAAQHAVSELLEVEENLEADNISYGEHHMTVTVFAETLDLLSKHIAEIKSIADEQGIVMMSEAIGAKAHYLSQHPGNDALRLRPAFVTNYNFAHLAGLHKTPMGKDCDELPWATPITVFPTQLGTPYRVSFHEKGSPDKEPTSGHTLILGRSGSGKSVVASFLAAQAQRVGARVIALDYRYGLEMSVRALGGTYSTINAGEKTGLNPLSVETDAHGVNWLADWLGLLLSGSDKDLTPSQTNAIGNAVRQNAEADEKLQNWKEFGTLLNVGKEGSDLYDRFTEWMEGGRYGWIFGESKADALSLEGDCIGYDLTGVLDSENNRERMAVLSYLFHRIERLIKDKRKTILLIDEAAVALNNRYFAEKLDKLCVTARKQNCVLVFMTQYAGQLSGHRAGETILKTTGTKLLLPNLNARASDYEGLQLGEKELNTILNFGSDTRLGLFMDDGGSVVVDTDLSVLGNGLTILGGLSAGERLVGENYRDNPNFWKDYIND